MAGWAEVGYCGARHGMDGTGKAWSVAGLGCSAAHQTRRGRVRQAEVGRGSVRSAMAGRAGARSPLGLGCSSGRRSRQGSGSARFGSVGFGRARPAPVRWAVAWHGVVRQGARAGLIARSRTGCGRPRLAAVGSGRVWHGPAGFGKAWSAFRRVRMRFCEANNGTILPNRKRSPQPRLHRD